MILRGTTALAVLALTLAAPARADEEAAGASAAAAAPKPDAPRDAPPAKAPEAARVRATHRVDVIAPGEKIDTVIDRLRASRPPPAGVAPGGGRPPARAPDGRRDDAKGAGVEARSPPDGARPPMDGARGPPGMAPAGGFGPGPGPGPDRMHR